MVGEYNDLAVKKVYLKTNLVSEKTHTVVVKDDPSFDIRFEKVEIIRSTTGPDPTYGHPETLGMPCEGMAAESLKMFQICRTTSLFFSVHLPLLTSHGRRG